jgi:hypothetical protein
MLLEIYTILRRASRRYILRRASLSPSLSLSLPSWCSYIWYDDGQYFKWYEYDGYYSSWCSYRWCDDVNTSSGTNMTVTIPVGAATDGATMVNTSSGTNMTVTIPVGAATDGATMVNTSNGTTMTVTIPACAATDGTPMVFPQDVWEHDIDTPNIDTQPTANTIHAQSASSAFLTIFRRGLLELSTYL